MEKLPTIKEVKGTLESTTLVMHRLRKAYISGELVRKPDRSDRLKFIQDATQCDVKHCGSCEKLDMRLLKLLEGQHE